MKKQSVPTWLKGIPSFNTRFFKSRSRWPVALLGLLCLMGIISGILLGRLHQQVVSPEAVSSPQSVAASPIASPSPTASPKRDAAKTSASKSPAAASSKSPAPSPKSQTPLTGADAPHVKPPVAANQPVMTQPNRAAVETKISVDALIEMRIAIAKGVSSLALGLSDGAALLDKDGKSLQSLPATRAYTVQASGNSIVLEGQTLPQMVWIEPPANGLFSLGGRTYRGRLLLVSENDRLWGVNFVNLKNYLYSVVASEVSSSWPLEALKAQAVAARSYALTYFFKPVNDLFHMGDDEYFQVYSGIDREAGSTNQAVDSTAGEFVSYRGGIVESLYAASDDIVAEAFQGQGMSQLGALNLAEKGYTYQQILANYYPSTGIGRIEADTE